MTKFCICVSYTCLSLDNMVETKVVSMCQRARLPLVDEGGG